MTLTVGIILQPVVLGWSLLFPGHCTARHAFHHCIRIVLHLLGFWQIAGLAL